MFHNYRMLVLVVGCCLVSLGAARWTQFRGGQGNGFSPDANPPAELTDANVKWTVALPGRGLSSPITVGDRVYVTCASGPDQRLLHVFCFDDATGNRIWERRFQATGRTMCHNKTCVAASSPASDGERIFALYSSNDLICLDLDGNLLWLRGLTYDYPNASNSLGMSSSPVVVDDTVVVQIENDSESFAAGLDVRTGENRWKHDRPKASNWTSPVVMHDNGRSLVALQSSRGIDAVVPQTGEIAWSYTDGGSTIPSSAVAGELLFVPSHGLTALRDGEVVWRSNRLSPSTASPVVLGDRVFVFNRAGVLNCADGADGELGWQLRLPGPFSASPVAASGRIYAANEDGTLLVVEAPADGSQGRIVSQLDFGETLLSTPAIANDAIYLRSDKHLWKIAK